MRRRVRADALKTRGPVYRYTCRKCKRDHSLPLDASGHYAGKVPCEPGRLVRVQVDPQTWRDHVMAKQAKTVH